MKSLTAQSIRVIRVCLLLFFQALFLTGLLAQPFTLKEYISPTELKFHPFTPSGNTKAKGKINITEVNQVKDTLYFFARGMSIYSPIYVSVDGEVPSDKIHTGIYKMNWLDANRKGTTDKNGHWETSFKTEMDFGIMVIPEVTPIKYSLIVWSGDEANFEMPTAFKKNIENSKNSNSKKFPFLYVVIGVMAIALIYLFFKLQKSKK